MDSPARGAWRPVRAGALTTITVVLAVGAHAAAGGPLPSWWLLSALTVPTACAAVLITRRRLSTPTVVGALGAAQLVLHQALSALAGYASCGPAHPTAHAGHLTTGTSLGSCTVGPHHHASTGMLLAHVVATLLTAVLLARGEAVLWALAERLDRALPVLVRSTVPVRPRLPRYPGPVLVRPRVVEAVVPVRRGPPALLRVTA